MAKGGHETVAEMHGTGYVKTDLERLSDTQRQQRMHCPHCSNQCTTRNIRRYPPSAVVQAV